MQKNKLENIYREISNLNNKEKKIILSKLINEIKLSSQKEEQYSIMGIKGLGKEIWDDIDAQYYVNIERASWD
ncbi:MAG TPA: hypothetical protein PK926_07505 [Spirochaetota bacterium]|nr:hypothetical protein [Spirochaetota bacterium]HPR49602.1 hypothetical protein [Spirochaetota bacterium]